MGHCCSKVKTHRKKRHKNPTKDHSDLVLDKFERDLVGSFGLKNLETPRFNDLKSSEILADEVEPSEVEVILEEISEAFETEKEIDGKKIISTDKKLKTGKASILFSGASESPVENKGKSPRKSRKSSESKQRPIDFSTNGPTRNLEDVEDDRIIIKETKQKKKKHPEQKPGSTIYYLDITDHHNIHAPQETPTFHSPSSRYDFVSHET